MAVPVSVDAYLDALTHPHLAGIRRLRSAILAADPRLTERVKWNAPSFAVDDVDLVTMRLAPRAAFQLVLHRGVAKVAGSVTLEDPHGLLDWKGRDRAVIDVRDDAREAELESAIMSLVRAWLAEVARP